MPVTEYHLTDLRCTHMLPGDRRTCFRCCPNVRPLDLRFVHRDCLGYWRPILVQARFPVSLDECGLVKGVVVPMSGRSPGWPVMAWVFSERIWPWGSMSWSRLPRALLTLGSVWRGKLLFDPVGPRRELSWSTPSGDG